MSSTRVTLKTVSLVDNIFKNVIIDTSLKLNKWIWGTKSDVFDNFSLFVSINSSLKMHKRAMHDTKLMPFKTVLCNVNWNSINHSPKINSRYKTFFKNILCAIGKKHFLKGFWIQSKKPKVVMDKQRIEKIVQAKISIVY